MVQFSFFRILEHYNFYKSYLKMVSLDLFMSFGTKFWDVILG